MNGTLCAGTDVAKFKVQTTCGIQSWSVSPNGHISGANNQQIVAVIWDTPATNAWVQMTYGSGGCTPSFLQLTINSPSTPSVTLTAPTSVCPSEPITLTANLTNVMGTPTYAWSIDGVSIGGNYTNSLTYNVTSLAPGPHTASVLLTNLSCSGGLNASASANFTVPANVGQVSAPSGPTIRCPGSGTSSYAASATGATKGYTWTISPTSAGNISNSGVVTWSSSFANMATIMVQANGCNGSSTTASTVVDSRGLGAISLSGTTSRCQGSGSDVYVATADNAGSYTYSLETPAAGTLTQGAAGYMSWNANYIGTATIKATATGCGITQFTTIDIVVKPTVTQVSVPAGETSICQGRVSTTYSASAFNQTGYTWSLTPGAGSILDNGTTNGINTSTVTWNSTYTGSATVTVVANGCGATTASQTVNVNPLPTASITPNGTIAAVPVTLTANAGTGYTYQWLKNGQPIGPQNSTYVATEPGLYSVKTILGGCATTAAIPASVVGGTYGTFSDPNWIKERNALVEKNSSGQALVESDMATLPIGQRDEKITYIDGLGRNMQTVSKQMSPGVLDLVQPVVYDNFGREAAKYLPYTSGNDGSYKTNFLPREYANYSDQASNAQYKFYQVTSKVTQDDRPYGETKFEESPLNRPAKSYGIGKAWSTAGSDKPVLTQFIGNTHSTSSSTTAEKVIAWRVGASTMRPERIPASTGFIETGGYFSNNQLSLTVTTDEEGGVIREFKNKLGQVILKKVQVTKGTTDLNSATGWALTYYIYDNLNNLRFVLQPELSRQLHGGADTYLVTDTDLNRLAFIYRYDERNRVVEKQVPGGGLVYMVYDSRDRVVLTQDAKQRVGNYWTFTKYDLLNRPVLVGIKDTAATRDKMQKAVNDYYAPLELATPQKTWRKYGEAFVGGAGASSTHGYTNLSYPQTTTPSTVDVNHFISVTYYDNYDYRGDWTGTYTYASDGLSASEILGGTSYTLTQFATGSELKLAVGQVTGTKAKVIDTGVRGGSTWLKSAVYYDDRYRPIQRISDNTKGLKDKISTIYDFSGRILKVRSEVNNAEATVVIRRYVYDAAGRLIELWHQIDGLTDTRIAFNEYNELGQLVDKKLHSFAANATDAKQSVDYRYNIRGWLSSINNSSLSVDALTNDETTDYFGMNLFYDKVDANIANSGAFNGNISGVKWGNVGLTGSTGERGYTYGYDASNRISASALKEKSGSSWSAPANNKFAEAGITYDLNGNIMSLTRNDARTSGLTMDILGYNYGVAGSTYSNRLLKVIDTGDKTTGFVDGTNSTNDYSYDENGSMVTDENKAITSVIDYNFMNLPRTVSRGSNTINYVYDAAGVKLSQTVAYGTTSTVTDYMGDLVFENNARQFANHEEGRVVLATNQLMYANDGSASDKVTTVGASASPVVINGQTYVKVTATAGSNTGAFPIGETFSVAGGDKYKIRIRGYHDKGTAASENPIYISVKTNSTDLNWPGAAIPVKSSSVNAPTESWSEQTITIPTGHTTLQIGARWSTSLSGEALYINDVEIIKLDKTPSEYQYHIKDHLGNVRLTFTTKAESNESLATFEKLKYNQEKSQFVYYDEAIIVNSVLFDHTNDAQSIPTKQVTGVSLSQTTATIDPAQTLQLKKVIVPLEGTNLNVSWSTSNANVATVSNTGLVTGVSGGTAVIRVVTQDGGYSATAAITVSGASSTAITNGEFDSGTTGWSLVDYTSPATATLSAVTGAGLSGTNSLRVDVTNADASGWMLSLVQNLGFRLQVGKSYKVTFMAKAQSARVMQASLFGNTNNNNYDYWELNLGTTAQTYTRIFNCTDGGVNSEANFALKFYLAQGVISDVWIDKVMIEDVTGLISSTEVSNTQVALTPGRTWQLSTAITPASATNQTVTWTSSNAAVASVTPSGGLIKAMSAGVATITGTTADGGYTTATTVNVAAYNVTTLTNPEFDSGTTGWSLDDYTGGTGGTISVATGAGLSGTNAIKVDQLLSDPDQWKLQLVQRLAFRLQQGRTYRVTYKAKAQSAKNITVSLFGDENFVNYGMSFPTISTTAQTYTFDYTCNDAGVDTESTFSLKFYVAGTVVSDIWLDQITIQDVTTAVPVTGITLSPTTVSLYPGQKSTLSPTFAPTAATNKTITWTTSNASFATVNSLGEVTGVAVGTATITATTQDGSKTATTTINVADPPSSYSTRLNGTTNEKYGVTKTLSVMPGDVITAEVYAKYLSSTESNWSAILGNLVSAIVYNLAPAQTIIDGNVPGSTGNGSFPFPNLIPHNESDGYPKAYLNYLVFDRNFVFKRGDSRRIPSSAYEDGTNRPHALLAFTGSDIVITEPGYVYIYISNESAAPVDVYFDDLKVTHTKGAIVGINDYYAFGMAFNNYVRENSVANSFQFNAKEVQDELSLDWIDYGARMYSPSTARWNQVDKLAEKYQFSGPFAYALNSPQNAIDPDGKRVIFVNGHWNTILWSFWLSPGYPKESYWKFFDNGGFINAARSFVNAKRGETNYFIDGSSRIGIDQNGKDRHRLGWRYAEQYYDQLVKGMAVGEEFRFVSHSEGAAFAAGMAAYLNFRATLAGNKNPHYVTDMLYLSPDEVDDFESPEDVPNSHQIHYENDFVTDVKPLKNTQFTKLKGEEARYAHGATVDAGTLRRVKNLITLFLNSKDVESVQTKDGVTFKRK